MIMIMMIKKKNSTIVLFVVDEEIFSDLGVDIVQVEGFDDYKEEDCRVKII